MKGNLGEYRRYSTIYDVAREAGVLNSKIVNVVNGNKNVKENTRKKF